MKNAIVYLSAAALIVCSCAGNTKKAGNEQEGVVLSKSITRVEVITAAIETVPQNSFYSSTVQAYAINNIAPQTANRIQKLRVDVGDFVSAGQLVAEMDKVQLEQAELKLKNSETELERVRQLLSEGGIAQSDFESLELSYNVAKSSYENLLENCELRSPINGVVTARNYDRGDMYSMGQPIFTVQQITPVKLLVPVSESDYTRVKKGDKVTLTVDALPGQEFRGSIARLYPMMDAVSHTFNVEVNVANTNHALRPGMYAKVDVNFGDTQNIVVPDLCVLKQQGSGQRSVFVVENGTAVSRIVTLGRHFDGKYEITGGLAEGEKVISKGQSIVKNGEEVEVIE